MQLTQKEQAYLQDAKKQEELCIVKYQAYSQQAQDPQLAQLMQTIANQEQQHLQTIQQMLQGQTPSLSGGSSGQQSGGGQSSGGMQPGRGSGGSRQNGGPSSQGFGGVTGSLGGNSFRPGSGGLTDQQICEDQLATEKAVSDLYEHATFEFTNHQMRQALDHIQQEEHHHAWQIWQYMNQQGWYQAQ